MTFLMIIIQIIAKFIYTFEKIMKNLPICINELDKINDRISWP